MRTSWPAPRNAERPSSEPMKAVLRFSAPAMKFSSMTSSMRRPAALRVGWLASTASTCREIRKVKLPYSLNIISEAIAETALEDRARRDANVARIIAERTRVFAAMQSIDGVTPCPSRSNFIFFRVREPRRVFDELCARGVLIREYADAL